MVHKTQTQIGPNADTPQSYVHNPFTWADALGLKAYKLTGVGPHTHTMRNKGVVCEQAEGNMLKRNGGEGLRSRTSCTDIKGHRRISDGATANGLFEVKNVTTQDYSKQIETAVEESVSRGGNLDLCVASETKVMSTIVNHPKISTCAEF